MSASKAFDNEFNKYALGYLPMPDFEAFAQDIQNQASRQVGMATMEMWQFGEFFWMHVLVVKKPGSCLKGTLSSQRVAAQNTCFGPFIYEGVPQAEPGVFGCWSVCRHHGSKDPPQVGLGVYVRT
jgi:hypothetical protein